MTTTGVIGMELFTFVCGIFLGWMSHASTTDTPFLMGELMKKTIVYVAIVIVATAGLVVLRPVG